MYYNSNQLKSLPPPSSIKTSISHLPFLHNSTHIFNGSLIYSSFTKRHVGGHCLEPSEVDVKPLKIYIGYDSREDIAYAVCKYSLMKRASIPIEIHPIKQSELISKGLYWRQRGKTESTEFSFTRFLTPYLANYTGWAMFIDCDFLYLADIKELVDLLDDKYALMCVHHDYEPKETTKMMARSRKNWSSMVLYNCGHEKNKVLTPQVVNTQTEAYLHRFQWLDDDEIGSVPFVWNFLVGHNLVVEGDPTTYPKAVHYTLGGPWFEAWKDCEFGELWFKELEEYEKVKKVGGLDHDIDELPKA